MQIIMNHNDHLDFIALEYHFIRRLQVKLHLHVCSTF